MRGAAEVHAALAALMWAERPALAFRAEQVRGRDRVMIWCGWLVAL